MRAALAGIAAALIIGCARPASFPGWQLEPYGAVEWHTDRSGMQLGGTSGSAGMYFRRQIDPSTRYRLTLAGHPMSGQTTVRLTFGNTPPRWLAAPDGAIAIDTTPGQSSIEVIVYSDTPYRYHVDDLRLDECSGCMVDAELKRLVVADRPALPQLLQSDRLAAARTLLDWAANVVRLGDAGVDVTPYAYAASAAQVYQDVWLNNAAGGMSCGGFSSFLAKLLSLFGYEAFTVDMGFAGTYVTHVTTAIALLRDGGLDFYIVDPTFNGVYRDRASNRIVSIDDLLTRGSPPVVFDTAPIRRDVLWARQNVASLETLLAAVGRDLSSCVSPQAGSDSPRLFCPGIPYDVRVIRAGWKTQLADLGIGPGEDLLTRMFTHHVFATSIDDPQVKQQFVALLNRHRIPHDIR
jgi:hypothetical protein